MSVFSRKRVMNAEPCISSSERASDELPFVRTSIISESKDRALVVIIHMSASRSGSSGMNTAACLRMAVRMRQMSSFV